MTNKKPSEPTEKLPEAPASATTNVKDSHGFYWMFTVRDEKAFQLLDKMKLLASEWKQNGWEAVEPRQGGFPKKPDVPTKPCPKHGVPRKERRSKSTGAIVGFSHSQGIYPNLEYCNGTGFPSESNAVDVSTHKDF